MNRIVVVLAVVVLLVLGIVGALVWTAPSDAPVATGGGDTAAETDTSDVNRAPDEARVTEAERRGARRDDTATESGSVFIRGTVRAATADVLSGVPVAVYAVPEYWTGDEGGSETIRRLTERIQDQMGDELDAEAEDAIEIGIEFGTEVGMEALADGSLADLLGAANGMEDLVPDTNWPVLAQGFTDGDGRFELEVPKVDRYQLRIDQPRFQAIRRYVQADSDEDYLLIPGVELRGVVRGPKGPISGATVRTTQRVLRTDAAGEFVDSGASPSTERVLVQAPGHVAAARVVETKDGSDVVSIVFELEGAGAVEGVVRNKAGKAIPGATLRLNVDVNPMDFMQLMNRNGNRDVEAPAPTAVTDADGRYRLDGIPVGTAQIVAAAPDYIEARRSGIEIQVDRTEQGVDFELSGESSLVGVVRDDRGTPLAGAQIRVALPAPEGATGMAAMMAQFSARTVSSVSRGDGSYTVEGLPPGTLTVTAKAPGYKSSRIELQMSAESRMEHDFALDPGLRLAGIVIGPDGTPIADADVEIDWPDVDENPMAAAMAAFAGFNGDSETTSNEEGKWTAIGLEDGPYRIQASAEGFLPATVDDIEVGTEEVVLQLRAAASIAGVVLQQDGGEVVPSAEVLRTGGPGGGGMMAMFTGGSESEPVEADGTFLIQGLEPGRYTFWARAKGFAEGEKVKVELAEGQNLTDVRLVLPPGHDLRGRVVRKGSGEPVGGALVYVNLGQGMMANVMDAMGAETAPPESVNTRTDAEGYFLLEGLTPGKRSVVARATGLARTTVSHDITSGDLTIELGVGGTLRGTVLDADGNPQSGAQVMLMQGMMSMSGQATTGADGSYEMTTITPGRYTVMLLDPSSPMGMGASKAVTIADDQVVVQDFGKKAGGRAVGGAVMRDGAPASGLTVVLMGGPGGMKMSQTGGDGRFRFDDLEPGTYQVMVQSGPMSGGTASAEVKVDADGVVEDVQLELSSLVVSGKLVDATSGEPVQGAQVLLLVPGSGTAGSIADLAAQNKGQGFSLEDGTFVLEGVQPGTYELRAMKAGYSQAVLDGVNAGTEGITVTMDAGTEIEVTVLDPSGNPLQGASISVRDPSGRESYAFDMSMSGMTGPDGIARLRIGPGRHEFTATADEHPPATIGVTPEMGSVTIKLEAGGAITVKVVDGTGAPIAGAEVKLFDASGKELVERLSFGSVFGASGQTDATGFVSRSGLPKGSITVRVKKGDGPTAEVTTEILAGSTTTVDVTLE